MASFPDAFFLPMEGEYGGQRLCLYHAASSCEPRGQMLYLHPFAEELNKTRRMGALHARALAAAGFDVLQIDLLGCGDSSGDFEDASWQAWIDDALAATKWLRQRQPGADAPLWLWGLRAGGLLAAELARRLPEPANLLLVQPPVSGKLVLQNFLRLKLAGNLGEPGGKGMTAALRQSLLAGQTVEVAGYRLSSGLASGLDAATMAPPPVLGAAAHVVWIEVSSQPDATPSPTAIKEQTRWQQTGYAVHSRIARGPAFWQTTEIEVAPHLIEASVEVLAQIPGHP